MQLQGRSAKPFLALFVFVVIVHFFAAINDGHYWDGWPLVILMEKGDWATLHELWDQTGQPLGYYLYAGFWHAFPDFIAAYRLAIPICMLIIAFSVLTLSRRVMKLPLFESWFIVAFTASWPFYNVFVSEVFLHYMVSLTLFYFAWVVYFIGEEKSKKYYTAFAFLLFALTSYTINSLLVFYYGFVMLHFLYNNEFLGKNLGQFCKKKWFLIIFPIFVFTAKTTFNQPYGIYDGYNSLVLHTDSIGSSFWLFVQNTMSNIGSLKLVIRAFEKTFRELWPWGLIELLIFGVALWRCLKIANTDTCEYSHIGGILAPLGLIFMLAAIIPYAAVNKYVYGGWGERHGMLLPFGLALMLAALSLWIKSNKKSSPAAFVLCFCLLFINGITLMHQYVLWEARAVVDKAVITNLRVMPAPKSGAVILYQPPKDYTIDSYRPYEVSALLYSAWEKEEWFGVATGNINTSMQYYRDDFKNDFKKRLGIVRDFTPNGCFFVLSAEMSDPSLQPWQAVSRDLYYRFFAPAEEAEFLRRLLHVQLMTTDKACE